uniref:Uncharacterized protein n=2 Tax=Rhizobium leguminosarum TaxID=384 RepID=A0A154IJR4_RHILE|nr:hypothetical protein A4A59_19345 [Rhizobium leguminosarum]
MAQHVADDRCVACDVFADCEFGRERGIRTKQALHMSLTPIALLVVALLLYEETLDGRRIFVIALGVCGLVVLFWPVSAYISLPAAEAFPGASLRGGLAVASAAFIYGCGSVLARPLLRTYPALFVSGVTTLVGDIVLLIAALAFEPGNNAIGNIRHLLHVLLAMRRHTQTC